MSEEIKQIDLRSVFKNLIIQSLNEKTGMPRKIVKFKTQETGVTLQSQRRDLTYPLCTFLFALRDMTNEDGQEYHEFRDVMAYAKKHYGYTPSDYPLLNRSNWWLAENGTKGAYENKYWHLTPQGKNFLNDPNFKVKAYFYPVPNTKEEIWSKKTTTLNEICKAFFSKNNGETWFKDGK